MIDISQLPRGPWGTVYRGIPICEYNRVTVFEDRRAGIETLIRIKDNNYEADGFSAVVFGVERPNNVEYAVFVCTLFLDCVALDMRTTSHITGKKVRHNA